MLQMDAVIIIYFTFVHLNTEVCIKVRIKSTPKAILL